MIVRVIYWHFLSSLKFNSFNIVESKVDTWFHIWFALMILVQLSHGVSALVSGHMMISIYRLKVVWNLSASCSNEAVLVKVRLTSSVFYLVHLIRLTFCLGRITERSIKLCILIPSFVNRKDFAYAIWYFVHKDTKLRISLILTVISLWWNSYRLSNTFRKTSISFEQGLYGAHDRKFTDFAHVDSLFDRLKKMLLFSGGIFNPMPVCFSKVVAHTMLNAEGVTNLLWLAVIDSCKLVHISCVFLYSLLLIVGQQSWLTIHERHIYILFWLNELTLACLMNFDSSFLFLIFVNFSSQIGWRLHLY